MGKRKSVTQKGMDSSSIRSSAKLPKRKLASATLHIEATVNNTNAVVTDKEGNAIFSSSAGALGFRGAKKGTPFAASKVGDVLAEKSELIGIKDIDVVIKGVGSGREPIIRSFIGKNIEVMKITDITPVPHNGPKPKKPRRI